MKIKGPLLSLGAHGSISKILTFSKKRTGQQTRKYNKPLIAPSGAQRGQRRLTEFLVAQWQNMSAGDKATWATNAKASGLELSGYHFFLHEAQRNLYTHHGLVQYLHCNAFVGYTIKDLSGNGLDMTLGAGDGTKSPELKAAVRRKFGSRLFFDTEGRYTQRAHNNLLNFGTGDFSIFFTTYLTSIVAGDIIMRHAAWVGWYQGFIIQTPTTNMIEVNIGDGVASDTTGWRSLAPNTMLDVFITRTSGNLNIYYNGALAHGPLSLPRNVDVNTPHDWGGQSWTIASTIKGYLDEMGLYNRALSAAEIATRQKYNDNV